jgi:hypothetical protein
MPFREITPFETFGWEAMRYVSLALWVVIPALTAFWAWSAYRCSKKSGYVWLAVLALTPYLTYTLHRVSNMFYRDQLSQRSYEPEDATIQTARPTAIRSIRTTTTLPLWQAGFAIAILLLYRAEMKQSQRNLANCQRRTESRTIVAVGTADILPLDFLP